jgi:signal transduction histidine kinase
MRVSTQRPAKYTEAACAAPRVSSDRAHRHRRDHDRAAVGWQILVVREFEAFAEGFTPIHWVLVILGSIFFALIITVLILQAVWLVREIRSNQRQQTFMDAVTHELHTPLASLRLYLDTLAAGRSPESAGRVPRDHGEDPTACSARSTRSRPPRVPT